MYSSYTRKESESDEQFIANALATADGVSIVQESGLESDWIALDVFGKRLYFYSSSLCFKKNDASNAIDLSNFQRSKFHIYHTAMYLLLLDGTLEPVFLIQKNENHIAILKSSDVYHVSRNGEQKQASIPSDFLRYTIFLRKKINDMLMLAFPALGVSNEATGSDELYVEKTSFHENIKLFFGHHNMQVGNTFQAQGADWVVFTRGNRGFLAVKKV